jgi:predicted acyl esterase
VRLWIRHPDEKFIERHENEWPLARTQWTKRYLDAGSRRLQTDPPVDASTAEYDATGEGVDFSFTVDRDTEITGPIAAKLFASSSSTDADLFLVVRVFDPDDQELTFQGALDPHTPIAQGWLRASHRKLDTERSLPHRPYHSHDEVQALTPTEVYELDVEIWPTCVVVPAGWRVTLTVRGKDYHYPGEPAKSTSGVGPFRHIDPDNRPADVFNGRVAVHTGGRRASYLLLPIIPAK